MTKRLEKFTPIAQFLLRLVVGAILFGHGLKKIEAGMTFEATVARIGFPFPLFFAWCAALSELLGGLSLITGLYIRIGAFFAGIVMIVAISSDLYRPFIGGYDFATVLLMCCVFFFFAGGGYLSLDDLLKNRRTKAKG